MERTPGVYLELLFRPGVRDEFRREALAGLAKLEKKTELTVLVDAIRQHDEPSADRTRASRSTWSACSPSRPQAELATVRGGPGEAGDRRPQPRSRGSSATSP